jgi:hypothetical protein
MRFLLIATLIVGTFVVLTIQPEKLHAQANTCPVTLPPVPAFLPPVGNFSPSGSDFFFGTSKLWVIVHPRHHPLVDPRIQSYRQKIEWWSEGFEYRPGTHPALEISGKRLDGSAPPLLVDHNVDGSYDVNGSYRDDMGSFIMSAVNFPTKGCWEITGKLQGTELKWVVSLE